MKIIITAKEAGIDADFDPTFGRCAYIALFDDESGYIASYENKAAKESGGAGIAAAKFVGGLQASAIITGHLGPNASSAVKELGLSVYYGHFSNIEEAFGKYRAKELTQANL